MINKLVLGIALGLIAAGCNFQHHDAAPELQSITPVDGATEVDTSIGIALSFSESMDAITCEERFSLYEGDLDEIPGEGYAPIPGSFSWNSDFTEMTFHPETPLEGNTDYSIILLEGMQGIHDHDEMMMDHDHDGGMMSHDMEGFGRNAGAGIIIRFKTQ